LKDENIMSGQSTQPAIISDEKIIDMYWKRNPNAIQETDEKYGALLRNVAYNILSDSLDCEECQNDTYFDIWNAIPSARPTAFSAFIVQIMRRTAIDRYRKKSSKKRIPSQLTVSIEELENSVCNSFSIEEAYEAKEIGKMVSDYVGSLNDRQRYIFIDRYYMAESVEKTAFDLSIPVKTAYSEIVKIKKGLKKYLERNGVHV
jgi:RNA polymerase sigma-70 factor (ECF subfamily)